MQSNGDIVSKFIEEVLNGHDVEATGKYFWDDMVEQVPLPGQGPGLQGLKDVLTGMFASFPDMHWTIQEQIAAGDKVVSRFEWTATHRGNFMGIPPTGKTVGAWGTVIDRLVDGKIKETRIIMDMLGLMMQLDVFPPPGA